MTQNLFNNIKQKYEALKTNRQRYLPRWEEVAKYVGIKVEPGRMDSGTDDKSKDLDWYTEDPTACISVQQAADYSKGIVWGTGDNVFSLEPSKELLDIEDKSVVSDWFEYAGKSVLEQMNHSEAGLNAALSAYFYDIHGFGTAAVGVFKNSSYGSGYDTNALIFRAYGVDSLLIDEGKNGLVETVINIYSWRVNRLVSEFCDKKDGFDKAMFEKLPDKVKNAYHAKNYNDEFKIIQAIIPRADFVPGALGKKGCRYIGYWFEEADSRFFYSEDYHDRPIAVGRAEKIRGEVYGRASGTMLLSTIRCINAAVSKLMMILEKMEDPALGVFSSALFGDDIIDTSAGSTTVLNAALLDGKQPIFKMQDIGDPTGIVNFLLPYLNEKVATAFKIDTLLDFASKSSMTATESLQRFSIRGKSLSGMITQQKTELAEPLIRRAVSLCWDMGLLGVKNANDEEKKNLTNTGRANRIIPESVLKLQKAGIPWYKIKFNNELDKLTKTERIDDILRLINIITALIAVYPQIAIAVNWHKLLLEVCEALGFGALIMDAKTFKAQIEAQAQQQAALMQAQLSNANAQANKDNAAALKEIGSNEQTA